MRALAFAISISHLVTVTLRTHSSSPNSSAYVRVGADTIFTHKLLTDKVHIEKSNIVPALRKAFVKFIFAVRACNPEVSYAMVPETMSWRPA